MWLRREIVSSSVQPKTLCMTTELSLAGDFHMLLQLYYVVVGSAIRKSGDSLMLRTVAPQGRERSQPTPGMDGRMAGWPAGRAAVQCGDVREEAGAAVAAEAREGRLPALRAKVHVAGQKNDEGLSEMQAEEA